jgi:hypothetical protein
VCEEGRGLLADERVFYALQDTPDNPCHDGSCGFDFLLLLIPWPLSWVICVVLLAVGIRIFVLSRREFDSQTEAYAKDF